MKRLSQKVSWRVWFSLLLLLAVGYGLARLSVPAYPYYDHNNVLYPWLILYNSEGFHIAIFITGIFLLFCLVYNLKPTYKKFVRPLIIGISIFACTSSQAFVFCNPSWLFSPTLTHKNTVQFEGKTYQLALSYGSSADWDSILAVYTVYECDSAGIVCHLFYCPFFESTNPRDEMYQNTAFIPDDQSKTLYVQIGPEKTRVRKQCQFGGGRD